MDKNELRKKYLLIRKSIKDKQEKSNIIFNKVINSEEYTNSRIIGLYNSLPNEVNTSELINYSLKNKKIVCLPRVVGKDILFFRIEDNSKRNVLRRLMENWKECQNLSFPAVFRLSETKWWLNLQFHSIHTFVGKTTSYIIESMNLLIVPGICFDKNKNRIGFGKGYYDRYLCNNTKSIGICFEEQICDNIEIESYDKKLDLVITDKNIYF